MNARVLLNAGGAGTRMGTQRPKPLVTVRGLPLIERNLLAVLGAGAREVFIVLPATRSGLHAWVDERATRLCAATGTRLHCETEPEPRGTAACLAITRGADTPVMMLYADNLTALDLVAFDQKHTELGADVTVAAHDQPFDLPFGRIHHTGDRVTAYEEKPRLPVTIASGAYVFSSAAVESIPSMGRFDTPALVRARLASGQDVRTFRHDAPWVDVNDPAARDRADHLVGECPALERFVRAPAPVVEVCGAILIRGDEVLLEWRPPTARLYPGVWDTPGGKLEPGETPAGCIRRELSEELALEGLSLRPVVTFDDLEPSRGWVRHHVFAATLDDNTAFRAREGQQLAFHAATAVSTSWASPAVRSVAYVQTSRGS